MLTRIAQPSKRTRRPLRAVAARCFSAAGGVLLATFMLLIGPAGLDSAAAAQGGTGAWPWPLLGEVVTPYRNGSDPYAAGQHRGLDIAAPVGTPVLAIVDGRVSFSGRLPDGGETVTVRSADGAWLVSDLHLSSRRAARGDAVAAGDVLGTVGTSGKRSADQPHLHLSVRRADDRAYVDPMTLLGPQRLPSSAGRSEAPAASRPVATSPAASAPRVHVTPLERGVHGSASVHAQTVGDSGAATRHGAHPRPATTGAGAPAVSSAREGHAAAHTSRVAPPPLKVAVDKPVVDASRAARPPTTLKARPREAHGNSPASRPLLLAVAAICGVALILRRRPRQVAAPPPTASPIEQDAPAAEVVELRRLGRRA